MFEELEASGELDNTVVVLSGDHGIPGIPRGKTNCYDLATRVPLLVRWPKGILSGRHVDDFVSVMDIGPTLLELTRSKVPDSMDGRSFLPQLTSKKSGWIDPQHNSVIIGRELHFHNARPATCRIRCVLSARRTICTYGISSQKRWPMGDPYDAAELTESDAL